jgi:hypothetical protein
MQKPALLRGFLHYTVLCRLHDFAGAAGARKLALHVRFVLPLVAVQLREIDIRETG